jgi:hypothetical protein
MNRQLSLETATVSQLTEHYIEIGIEQDDALLRGDTKEFNRLFDRLRDIEHALRARKGDQRRNLISLFNHSNMQVRLNAAKATLAISPQAGREALEAIRASKWQPQAGDAGMCLRALDQGIFKPT